MARFKNTETGSIVSVDDSKADRFGTGWESLDEKPKRSSRAKKSDDEN